MKRLLLLVVIMIAAVVGASILSVKLNQMQRTFCPEKFTLSASPLGGFHKFASDVEWMRLVNYLGSLNTVDESNVKDVANRLEKLISYDPNLEKIYKDGVLVMSIADPTRTVEFLSAACNNDYLKNNWQIPFYAGYVMMHGTKPPKYKEAADFFLMAMKRSGSDSGAGYVVSSYIRAKARDLAKGGDEKLAMLKILFQEWEKSKISGDYNASRPEGGSLIPDLNNRIIKAIRDIKVKSEDYTPSKEAEAFADMVIRKVFENAHICHGCTSAYQAGEGYCSQCGLKLAVWGLCGKCHKTLTPGAKFCGHCGQKAGK